MKVDKTAIKEELLKKAADVTADKHPANKKEIVKTAIIMIAQ